MTAPMLPGANRFRGRKRSLVAFTLVELMVVIGISMLLLSLAVPAFVRRLDNASIQKAVNEVLDICRDARAHAILRGSTAALRIQPATRTLQVVMLGTSRQTAGAAGDLVEEGAPVPGGSSEDGSPAEAQSTGTSPLSGVTRVVLDDSIQIEGLGINGEDWTDDELAEVRFFANGTSDEMSIVLLSRKNERRNIFLEVVTALADVETDVAKFRAR